MIFRGHSLVLLYFLYASIAKGLAMIQVGGGGVITCIFNLNYYHIKLILMLILCNSDACYHSFMKFSQLTCPFTKVHIFA